MRRRCASSVLIACSIALAPAAARACGACADAHLLEWGWWTRGLDVLLGALLFEMIVVGLGLRLAKVPVHGNALWLVAGIACGIGLTALGAGPRSGLGVGLAICLLLRFVRSLRAMLPAQPRVGLARLGLVLCMLGFGLFLVRPAAYSTDQLVRRITGWTRHGSVPDHLRPTAWVDAELVSRPDAAQRLMARLDRFTPTMSEQRRNRERILQLLRAHAMADGDVATRRAACDRLGVTPDWHPLLAGKQGERVCGFQPPALVTAALPGS